MFKNIVSELKMRNLIFQISDEKKLMDKKKNKNVVSIYCGFDATADSLHLGHLIPLLVLKRFQLFGFKPIIVVGGATGLIGDPSFKTNERQLNKQKIIVQWSKKISLQISSLMNFDNKNYHSALILNNYEWLKNINLLFFLRDFGKKFSINRMINRDSVKERINRIDKGISFTEFSYSLLQAYDFYFLYKKYKVILQIGGSDQWGNISSGIHLVKTIFQKKVFGLTLPLLVTSDGKKFGKSEGKPIWLDPNKTSPYKFYQFWINIDDKDIYLFFQWLTFFSYQDICNMQFNSSKNNYFISDRILLAKTITKLVHGETAMLSAVRITDCLFFGNIDLMKIDDFNQLKKDGIPSFKLSGCEDIQTALVLTALSSSRSQAKNMILANAISINMVKITQEKKFFSNSDKLFGKFTLLQRGKKNYSLLYWN